MPSETPPAFDRQVFEIARALEFFTERELSMQLGVARGGWPVAIVKELADNGLDAAEAAGVTPEIVVTLGPDSITVQDNGAGIAPEIIRRSLNYRTRTSDKLLYGSPSRGQLGNALKTLWAIPYVVSGERGVVEVATPGRLYRIEVSLDSIRQQPRIELTDKGPVVQSRVVQ